jgi:hypothetical protein
MENTAQINLQLVNLMHQLEHECYLGENQFDAIKFAIASAKIPAETKIQIIEGIDETIKSIVDLQKEKFVVILNTLTQNK